MADGNPTDSGMERFAQTAIAFDELIVQVGRAVARAQQAMDGSRVDFQREVARALLEGRMKRLEVPAPQAYTLPETTLDLRIGLSMRYPEGGGAPSLSALPLNAATTNQGDVDVEASTEVSLRFVSVPSAQEPRGAAPSALGAEQVGPLARQVPEVEAAVQALGAEAVPWAMYDEEARLWTLAWTVGGEPGLVVLVDDRRQAVLGLVSQTLPPSPEELAPVGAPRLGRVVPASASQGEVVTVEGEDLLTLAGQTVLKVDGVPVPLLRLSLSALAFKVPAWWVRGDLEVVTPLGSTGEAGRGAFTPLPRFESFEPRRGTYDTVRRRGTWLALRGANLRPGCQVRFATGAMAEVEVLSATRAQVEVPPGAGSGPLTFLSGGQARTLPAPTFLMLPRVDRVSPRQARVGEEVTVSGSSLEQVDEVRLGGALIPRAGFLLQTPEVVRFLVPPEASDGPVVVRQRTGADEAPLEARSRDLFYVVPRMTGFSPRVVTPGQLLTVQGEGLDPEAEMMVLLFDGRGGPSEAPVLAVAGDRRSLTTRAPTDAVTGYVLLLRKRVYSDSSAADTSNTSLNKLTVLTAQGAASDVLLEERFEGTLAAWAQEAGAWRVEQGVLASTGPSRLGWRLPEARQTLAVYADVLGAQRWGFSLVAAGGGDMLQAWMDLTGPSPALTWSTVDGRGRQTLLGGVAVSLLAGRPHLAQLEVAPRPTAEGGGLLLSFLLDQEVVHTQGWARAAAVERLGLLGDGAEQRWDNVVVLKGPVLALPEPELYRFGTLPTPPAPPLLRVDGFAPREGGPGTRVEVTGVGLDEAASFFFSGAEAQVVEAQGSRAVVEVPEAARTGPLEVRGRGGAVVTTGEQLFLLPPRLTGLVPTPVLAGEELYLTGTNLPTSLVGVEVEVLGTAARVVSVEPSLLVVLAPEVSGTGPVEVRVGSFTAQAPQPLTVRREQVLQDLVEAAAQATWSTAGGEVVFGAPGEAEEAVAQTRAQERLEDDRQYGPVLYLRPPPPSLRALRGVFPTVELPATGALELRLAFGLPWGAAPQPEEGDEVDGVLVEVAFREAATGVDWPLLPRSACVFDGSLERYTVDASGLAGRRGQLVLSLFPGRGGLRDELAGVSALLVRVT